MLTKLRVMMMMMITRWYAHACHFRSGRADLRVCSSLAEPGEEKSQAQIKNYVFAVAHR